MYMNLVKSFRKLALHPSKKDKADTVLWSQIFTAYVSRNMCYTLELLAGSVVVVLSCTEIWQTAEEM
jgi:hypothetical protein